ncbi:DUF3455 domain-containing protein [Cupriavidus basilensis]|uniref:DUF3455 domain-containing protein n=1 Tax=Cupriavidus basilensis TaxID=68895 RepID=UPI00283D66DA|nr:DUF3455 domain-containing protein [Cupriavidus basilensis]MDR3384191.1 DUF3455 domain-containing protein [Cupriavidus basilensis]
MQRTLRSLAAPLAAISALVLAACAGTMPAMQASVDNATLPEPVRAPAGHKVSMVTTGAGEITYECREKKDTAGQFEWAFVGPVATLADRSGKIVGKYYGGPTWEAADGSKVGGKQVAVAPNGSGNIPLQLVKADPAMGAGAMNGVTYIQRLKTEGGVAPAAACNVASRGSKQQVPYRADYVFYTVASM